MVFPVTLYYTVCNRGQARFIRRNRCHFELEFELHVCSIWIMFYLVKRDVIRSYQRKLTQQAKMIGPKDKVHKMHKIANFLSPNFKT